MTGLMLVPPAPDRCQVCAAKHDPDEPHNQNSVYYQVAFEMGHGRYPTWEDAMAHCDDEMRRRWRTELARLGVELEVADGDTP